MAPIARPPDRDHTDSQKRLHRRRGLSRWWLHRSPRIKGWRLLAVPMVAFITVIAASLALQLQERSQRRVAITAAAVTRTANQVLTDAVNAEAGVSGFAATGDPTILTPYTDAVQRLPGDMSQLRAAVSAAHQSVSAETAEASVATEFARLASLRSLVRLDVASGQAFRAAVTSQQEVMDRLRTEVAALAGASDALANRKSSAADRTEGVVEAVELIGLAVATLIGLACIGLRTSGISRRLQIAVDNADLLGDGVALVPTVRSDDGFGRLGSSLVRAEQMMTARLDQVNTARDHALLATKAKANFISNTSHELRTPLNAILGFAQLLEMSELSVDDRDSAQRILTAGRHLLILINELIDTSRVETGDLKLSMQSVLLDGLADEIAILMQPLAAARNITMTHDHASDAPLAVYADPLRLRQVLINLTSNAIKYNRVGGTVTISCCASGVEQVAVSVSDTGPGLTPQEIERIFIPFERLEASQHGVEGTGIGLPLALALTEAMHGVLDVDSVPGHGATFTVRLPRTDLRSPRAEEAVAASRADTVGDLTSVVVLSIEDNPANALLLSRLFQRWPGATLHSANTGRNGIELALQHRPHVILLDLHMPDLSGEDVLEQLRAEPATANIPVIVLSADATRRSIRQLIARGVSGYLTKPVDLHELHELVNKVVQESSQASRT